MIMFMCLFSNSFLSIFQTQSKPLTDKQKELLSKSLPKKKRLENVRNILLVASGKGGVGKSTTAGLLFYNIMCQLFDIDIIYPWLLVSVNLAIALKQQLRNQEVGLLDMDVFGPSLPIMMNLGKHKPDIDESETNCKSETFNTIGLLCSKLQHFNHCYR